MTSTLLDITIIISQNLHIAWIVTMMISEPSEWSFEQFKNELALLAALSTP